MILGKYQHYKGNLYQVIGVAQHSETREELVVYHSLDDEKNLWVRPKTMFLENVKINGQVMPRFKYLEK